MGRRIAMGAAVLVAILVASSVDGLGGPAEANSVRPAGVLASSMPTWRIYSAAAKRTQIIAAATVLAQVLLQSLRDGDAVVDGSVGSVDMELSSAAAPVLLTNKKGRVVVRWSLERASSPSSVLAINEISSGVSTLAVELDSVRARNVIGGLLSLGRPSADLFGKFAKGALITEIPFVPYSASNGVGYTSYIPYSDDPSYRCQVAKAYVDALSREATDQLYRQIDKVHIDLASALASSFVGYDSVVCDDAAAIFHGTASSGGVEAVDTANLPDTSTHGWEAVNGAFPKYGDAVAAATVLVSDILAKLNAQDSGSPGLSLAVNDSVSPVVVTRVDGITAVSWYIRPLGSGSVKPSNVGMAGAYSSLTVVLNSANGLLGFIAELTRWVPSTSVAGIPLPAQVRTAAYGSIGADDISNLHNKILFPEAVPSYATTMTSACVFARTAEFAADELSSDEDSVGASAAEGMLFSGAAVRLAGIGASICSGSNNIPVPDDTSAKSNSSSSVDRSGHSASGDARSKQKRKK